MSDTQGSRPAFEFAKNLTTCSFSLDAGVEHIAGSREHSDDDALRLPAAEQKRVAMEKFEKFRAEGIISAAAIQRSHGVPTKVTTVGRVN